MKINTHSTLYKMVLPMDLDHELVPGEPLSESGTAVLAPLGVRMCGGS